MCIRDSIMGAANSQRAVKEMLMRKATIQGAQEQLILNDAEMKGKATMTTRDRADFNMKQALLRSTVAYNNTEIAGLKNKINLSNTMIAINKNTLTYKTRAVFVDKIMLENDALQAAVKMHLADAKAVNIKLDQTSIATTSANAKMGLIAARSDIKQAQTGAMVVHQQKKKIAWGGMATNSLMLASMITMMFSDSEEAATASMFLMTAAMVPMTLSMLAYAKTAETAAFATSVATVGFAVVAGAAAYMIAKATKGTSEFEKEQQAIQEEMNESKVAMELLQEEMDAYADNSSDAIQRLEGATVDSLDTMGDAMNEFDNKRQEIFFGGRAGRMDTALFREIRLNGVEKLYFAPEVSMTNNFNGLTYDKATEVIAEKVLGRLENIIRSGSLDTQGSMS